MLPAVSPGEIGVGFIKDLVQFPMQEPVESHQPLLQCRQACCAVQVLVDTSQNILENRMMHLVRIMCPDGKRPGFVADEVGVEGANDKVVDGLAFLRSSIPSSLTFATKNTLPSFLG